MDDFRFEKSKILQTCPARGSTIKTKSNNKWKTRKSTMRLSGWPTRRTAAVRV
jgi:hypothetical protein